MRLIVMFDLPTETSKDRKNYRKFRRFLIKNGYVMMQYSIYSKIILNRTVLNHQKTKLKQNAPDKGFVELLIVTENQYANKEVLVDHDKRSVQENTVNRTIEL